MRLRELATDAKSIIDASLLSDTAGREQPLCTGREATETAGEKFSDTRSDTAIAVSYVGRDGRSTKAGRTRARSGHEETIYLVLPAFRACESYRL